jgi:hypothetical protein
MSFFSFFLGVLLALFFRGRLTLGSVPCSQYTRKASCRGQEGCTWKQGQARIGAPDATRAGSCVATG